MLGFRIPIAGFRIPKPWIPDSTDQNYLDSGFRITLHGAMGSPAGNGLLKITRFAGEITMNEAAHTISLISPSKTSSSLNTMTTDPTYIIF